MPIWRVQKPPIIIMCYADQLQGKEYIDPDNSAFPQSQGQTVQAVDEDIVLAMAKERHREGTDDDHHHQGRVDARTQEQDRQEGRKPKRVKLSGGEQKHSAERRLVQCREDDARNRQTDRGHECPSSDTPRFDPLENGRTELEYLDRKIG